MRRLPYAVGPPAAREALGGVGEPDVEGWVTATLAVESEEVAHSQLTALGPKAGVRVATGLREWFAGEAARTAALYRRADTG
ncbi:MULTISPECIES: hypothetical protein [Streptomyces]|uniref:hypothetical protein n=1 Tax=Streptomyces TaxID=1883 RepID=UPI000AF1A08B|nr:MULTISPECIES: hypothetical protein [Streptomyces]MCH0555609.1 hypothetical protein [Streptomyces sp. MUM 16J]